MITLTPAHLQAKGKQMKKTIGIAVIAALVSAGAQAGFVSNPAGTLESALGGNFVRWDMNGYPPSYSPTGSDILYAGEGNTWSLALPGSVTLAAGAYTLQAWVALDPATYPLNEYSLSIKTNGTEVYNGNTGLSHGNGVPTTNWAVLNLPVSYLTGAISLEINVAPWPPHDAYGNWVAFDTVELALPASVPIPAAFWLFGSSMLGLFGLQCRYTRTNWSKTKG